LRGTQRPSSLTAVSDDRATRISIELKKFLHIIRDKSPQHKLALSFRLSDEQKAQSCEIAF
jgi:hypothetical protein